MLAEGTRIGDFQIRGLLGEGTMGQVYLAHDITLGRRVALKFIRRSVMKGDGIERFLEEARATASFNHPHIVTLHAVGQHDGRPYLALEYIDGETLRARLAGGPLPMREALRYCRAVADAMAEAHQRGLVHADLKPENIVIPRDGRVRVVDFGVAKLVGGAPHAASGTPAYMAPERWCGEPPTGAIDVWALGVTLHELIAGRRPFADTALPRLPFAVGGVQLPELPEAPWAELVRDCLALEPAARPTAEEVVQRLAELLGPGEEPRGGEPAAPRRRLASSTRDLTPVGDIGTAPAIERVVHIDYEIERRRHEGFVGREALLDRLDQLLASDGADVWVAVTGGPGMGKTALLAAWLARREAAGAAVPHHFIRRGEYDWDVPAKLIGSLVAQIEARFPGLHEPDADARKHPAARLAAVLARVSANELTLRGERLVVVLDGLDEYDPPAGAPAGDPLAAFLPHALPRGVSLLCASRPRYPYVSSLQARDGELVQIDLDDPDSAADNDATVRAFWERAAPALGLDARFIDEAVACAGGNVQHAVALQRHLAVLPAAERRVQDIPRGLAALIEKSWERIAIDPAAVGDLGILCAAREPLTLDEIGAVAGWTADARRRVSFVRGARELLVETRRADGQPEYRLHHASIRAHIAGVLGTAAIRAHHAALARRLATWPAPAEPAARRYALRHALTHRAEAGDWTDAWRIAADTGFLEARCRELGPHEAEAEAARVAERCRAGGGATLHRWFGDLARAIARESHWLRAAPEATAALIWNRLRRSGWSPDDIDAQLRVSGPAFLRVRHETTRASPALVRNLVDHSGGVNACAVTAAGRRVVSASEDGTVKVWDLGSGRVLVTLEGHASVVSTCAVTPDGWIVISSSEAGALKVWDVGTRRVISTLKGHIGWVNACAVTSDGRRVVSASDDRTLKVWELESGRVLATLQGHTGWVRACAVTADGRRAVSASVDRTLKVWDLRTGRELATLEGHTDWVRACAVTPDGRRVVSASYDRTLRIWDLETGRALAVLEGHAGWVSACAVTPDGRRVVSASYDRTLRIWDLETGRALATLEGHTAVVNACAVTPDGRHVISASADRSLKVWDLEGGRAFAALEGHGGVVGACAVTPDARRVISASADRTLKVWDIESGRVLATLEGHASSASACAVTPDGRVVSGSYDRTLKVWDLETGRVLATLEGHARLVSACAVTPDGRRAVSASADRTLRVWDLETGRMLATLEGHVRSVSSCAVTPDGRRVVSASYDRTLRVWDLESGRSLAILSGHGSVVSACAITPDGRRVVSASWDKTLRIWDLESGQVLATLSGHAGWVSACAVTPDGRRAVSASDDRTLRVWDLDTHACLFTHRGDAPYTTVTATSTAIVAGDDAGALWVLELPR